MKCCAPAEADALPASRAIRYFLLRHSQYGNYFISVTNIKQHPF